MQSPSHYRTSGRAAGKRRSLSFFDVRFLLAIVFALAMIGWSLSGLRIPRTVTIECVPDSEPSLRCSSKVRSVWGMSGVTRAVLKPPRSASHVRRLLAAPPPGTFEELKIRFVESGRSGFVKQTRLLAGFDSGPPVELTEKHVAGLADSVHEQVSLFQAALRQARSSTLDYKTGWGNVGMAFLLVPSALVLLWVCSGRTHVRFDPQSGRVEIRTEPFWLLRGEHRSLSIEDIEQVIVSSSETENGRTFYRPALRLKSGEVLALGSGGLATPDRAQHWARHLRRLLGLKEHAS